MHTKEWATGFSRNSGTYIVYNSHVTCSNSSFSLTMVTPTFHFFAFHWLCSFLPNGYLPKPGSVCVRICQHHRIQPRPHVKVIFRYLRPEAPVSTSTNTQHLWAWWNFGNHLVDIFPRSDAAVSSSTNTQHLWAWWHSDLINLSVSNIRCIHTCRWR